MTMTGERLTVTDLSAASGYSVKYLSNLVYPGLVPASGGGGRQGVRRTFAPGTDRVCSREHKLSTTEHG